MNSMLKPVLLGLLISMPTGVMAGDLGRLFFTPEQRMQLEHRQQQDDDPPAQARSPIINGIVQKHGGGRTVWINGEAQIVEENDEHASDRESVFTLGQSHSVKVKVGQARLTSPAAGTGK